MNNGLLTYPDGIKGTRCEFCGSLLKTADDQRQVSIRVDDVEEMISLLVEYIDLPEVWDETIQRFERALGQTWPQIKERLRCERLSKETSTS